jgi:hypothetical protein
MTTRGRLITGRRSLALTGLHGSRASGHRTTGETCTSKLINPKRVPRICGLTPSEAVKGYADAHLAAAVWQTADFRKLDSERQVEFRDLIKSHELWVTVYKLLLVCLQHEVPLRDRMIDSLHHLRRIHDGEKLSGSERRCLLARQQELWFQYVRLLAEEIVLHSDEAPPSAITGRWRPQRMSKPMPIYKLAKTFDVPRRGVLDRLKEMGIHPVKHGRQAYSVPLDDLPDEK